MSCEVLPSPAPVASSASLLDRPERTTLTGAQLSAAATAASMSTIRWLGGQRDSRLRVAASVGASVSFTVTLKPQAPRAAWPGEVAVPVPSTPVVPTGKKEPAAGCEATSPQLPE